MGVRLSTVRVYDCTKEPYLNICGNWLVDAGFKAGSKFVMEVTEKGEIILKVVDEEV